MCRTDLSHYEELENVANDADDDADASGDLISGILDPWIHASSANLALDV